MKLIIIFFLGFLATRVFAIGCDCEVIVHSPMTGSYQMKPNKFKTYQLEEFSSYSAKNQNECRKSCLKSYESDMSNDRLNALLIKYTESLIAEQAVGYNCTGLTTLKYPVRVKAKLGILGLGNVADVVQVINHEQVCF